MSDQVTKIYELKTLGYSQVQTELEAVAQSFRDIKAAKKDVEAESKRSSSSTKTETAEIIKQKEALAALKVEEQRLKVEKQQLVNESKALLVVRQQEINQQRQQKAATDAAAGSYNALNRTLKELYAQVKGAPKGSAIEFRGQTLQYDQAIIKLQELSAAEQDFRRQFSRDSLLVGEYTSGIVQAFKQMGLDDLIGGQVNKANERLQMLDNEFKDLQSTLSQIKVTGEGSLEGIEKQLIENRKEAIALKESVGDLEKELKSTGDVGNKITSAISEGFKQIKGQAVQFALSFVGIQAVFNKLSTEVAAGIEEAKQIEGVEAAFKRLNDPGLLSQLRAATKGTVSDLELMKQAVQASNFEIPLETLGNLLDFARRRAKDTGQEVDFLVQSIITGIGRKSPLILDNLGISAVRLKENLKGVTAESASIGDVATAVSAIISEENAKAGKEIDTTTESLAQQRATWQNLRTELGQGVLPILSAIGAVLLFLLTNLTTIIGVLGLFALGWALTNKELVIANARLLLVNAQIVASRIALGAITIFQTAYNASLALYTGIARGAAVATTLLGTAMRLLPIGIILTILGVLVATFRAFAAQVTSTNSELKALAMQQQINADISRRVADATTEQISKMQVLTKVAGDNNVSLEGRKRALQDLININPEYLKGLTLENLKTEEGIGILNRYVLALREKASLEAAQAIRNEKLQKDTRLQLLQFELEKRVSTGKGTELEDLPDELKEFVGNARKQFNFTASLTDLVTGESAAAEALRAIKAQRGEIVLELDATDEIIKERFANTGSTAVGVVSKQVDIDIAELQDKLKGLNEAINSFKGSQTELNKLITDRDATQKRLDSLLGKKSGGGSKSGGSKAKEDPFKNIDALLNANLATLELSRAENKISEEEFLKEFLTINQKAIASKLELIKKTGTDEIRIRAELNLSRIQLEKETQDKLFELREKEVQKEFDLAKRIAEAAFSATSENASESERIDAQLKLDNDLLQAQITFNQNMDAIEKDFNKASIENSFERAEAIKAINRQLTKDQVDQLKNDVKVLEQEGETAVAKFQEKISQARLALSNQKPGKGKANDKVKAGNELDRAENRGVLAIEVENLQKLLPKYKTLLDQKLITDEEYYRFLTKLNDKAAELNNAAVQNIETNTGKIRSIGDLIRSGAGKLFGFENGSEGAVLFNQIVTESFDLAKSAMNSYFDAEIERINQSKQAQIERLDLEKNQLLARAQSRDEEISIEQQFQSKKAIQEQKAGERIKKIKKAEAKIALAVELGNLAVSAAQNPLNGVSFGAAGIAMYALLAGLAIGRYAMRVNDINKTQFEYGGQVPTETGGKITGPSHAAGGVPFNYEAEGNELAIIRTKNAPAGKKYSISGTHTQIASALNQLGGGKGFMPGASLSKFEYGGSLGESLQAPVFTPASNTLPISDAGSINQVLDLLTEQAKATQAVNARIDRFQVYQVTSSVTSAQRKEVIQDEIGTL
jgi:hypothetical protein